MTNQSLVLQKLKRSSAGIYVCKASNIEGEGSSNAVELNIMCKKNELYKYRETNFTGAQHCILLTLLFHFQFSDKPVCKMEQKRVYGVAKGEQVEIECTLTSHPKADNFNWAFNNSAESIDVPQVNLLSSNWIAKKI